MDMLKFYRFINLTSLTIRSIHRNAPFMHVLADIVMGFKSMGGGQKTGEQFIPVLMTKLPHHSMACGNLGTDKVKQGVVHVK
jgi:hypothetical protein